MNTSSYKRRQVLQALTTLSILSALPASVIAQIVSASPPANDFDDSTTAEQVTEGIDLTGQTIAITGANSGLGYETMRVLALRGAHIIGIARTQEKADKACASIKGETTPVFLDLADWESVVRLYTKEYPDEVISEYEKAKTLKNMMTPEMQRDLVRLEKRGYQNIRLRHDAGTPPPRGRDAAQRPSDALPHGG